MTNSLCQPRVFTFLTSDLAQTTKWTQTVMSVTPSPVSTGMGDPVSGSLTAKPPRPQWGSVTQVNSASYPRRPECGDVLRLILLHAFYLFTFILSDKFESWIWLTPTDIVYCSCKASDCQLAHRERLYHHHHHPSLRHHAAIQWHTGQKCAVKSTKHTKCPPLSFMFLCFTDCFCGCVYFSDILLTYSAV